MRRPVISILAFQMAGILSASAHRSRPIAVFAATSAGVLAYILISAPAEEGILEFLEKKRKRFGAIMTLIFFFSVGFFRMEAANARSMEFASLDEAVAGFEGRIEAAELRDGYVRFTVSVLSWDLPEDNADVRGEGNSFLPLKAKIFVNLSEVEGLSAQDVADCVGRIAGGRGKFYRPSSYRNPGGFDYELYTRTQGIDVLCRVSKYKFAVGEVAWPILHFLEVRKAAFLALAAEKIGREELGIMAGVLFGEKRLMSEEIMDEFRDNSIAHVLAVSGLHVGVLHLWLQRLLKNRSRLFRASVSTVALLCYAVLSGFSVSVLRACTMAFLAILAPFLGRRYDLISAACFSACLILAMNPLRVMDGGFQLSFVAVCSVGFISPYLEEKLVNLAYRYERFSLERVLKPLIPSIAAQLGLVPLCIYKFMRFSPIGIFLNPLAVAVTAMLVPAGLVFFLISLWATSIGGVWRFFIPGTELCFSAAGGVCGFLCRILAIISSQGARILEAKNVVAPPLGMLLIYFVALFFLFSEGRFAMLRSHRRSRSAASLASFLILAFSMPAALGYSPHIQPWKYPTGEVVFLDVAQGDGIHISTEGRNILIDGGGHRMHNMGERVLLPYFLRHGIDRIDFAILTHRDIDHMKGLEELSSLLPIETLILSEVYRDEEESFENILREKTLYLRQGDVFRFSDSCSVKAVHPVKGASLSSSENKNSLAIVLSYGKLRVFFTGDMGFEEEENVLRCSSVEAGALKSHILKLGHHGSAFSGSSEFLRAVSPAFGVISCGRNNFHGHPSPIVIEKLQDLAIMFGRTDEYGAICVRCLESGEVYAESVSGEKRWLIIRRERAENTLIRFFRRH